MIQPLRDALLCANALDLLLSWGRPVPGGLPTDKTQFKEVRMVMSDVWEQDCRTAIAAVKKAGEG